MHFDYGTTTGYGKRTPDVVLNGDAGEQWVAARPTGLAPNTTYHARLVSVGADGTQASSADVTFTSAAAGPTLGAAGAASVGSTTAALNVQVDPNGQSTRYHVDYGDDASYGRSSADVDAGSAEAFADGQAALAGLDPSTTYHYRVVAANAGGTSYGPDGTFTTASAGPTLGPPNVLHPAARSGEVSLAVGPNGQATTLHVEYGATASYGQRSDDVAVDAASGDQAVAVTLRGLTPATDYHLRVVATNASGTQATDDLLFSTEPAGPTVLTGDALAAGRSATFSGQVNPNGEAVTYHFEYGRTTAYGTRTPDVALPAGDDYADAGADVVGLAADTTYHVRLVATSASGTRSGDDDSFATDQPGPSVSTGSAGALTGYAASIAGTVNPNGLATTYRFEYGPTTAYGSVTATQSLAAGYRTGAVSAALAGLLPGRTYHYRVAATNASGTRYGDDATLATTALPPDVTTGAASGLGTHTATVALQVNPNGDATSFRIEYGPTTAYQQQAVGTGVGSGTGVVTAMQSLTGLARGHALPLPGGRRERRGGDRRPGRDLPHRRARRRRSCRASR